jgi:hypothetical protein
MTGAILFIAGAAAAWYLLSGKQISRGVNSTNSNVRNSQESKGDVPTPSPRPSASQEASIPARQMPSQRPTEISVEQARQEVSQFVDQWRSNTESMDVDSYMANYAPTVDYYKRRGATWAQVRNDKTRAFGMYHSIRMDTSNMTVSVDESSERATAEFDKEWDFRGDRNSSGKVRTELRLRRKDGRWLIIGERDVKVYYVN